MTSEAVELTAWQVSPDSGELVEAVARDRICKLLSERFGVPEAFIARIVSDGPQDVQVGQPEMIGTPQEPEKDAWQGWLFEPEVMIDVSRNAIPTREALDQMVEWCSSLGIGRLGIYTEQPPPLGQFCDPKELEHGWEAEEWRDFVRAAGKKGVFVYPYIETLSHLERIVGQDRFSHFRAGDAGDAVDIDHPEIWGD